MKHFKQNIKLYFLVFLLFLNIFIFYSLYYINEASLIIAFLNVGQGDAIFIEAPGGVQMLIDGGPDNKVLRELGQVMPFYDRSIDVVVATHADQDHIGGLVEVLKRFNVGLFIRTNTTSTSAVYNELENLVKEKKIKKEVIISPKILSLGSQAEFDIFFPNQNTSGWETNDSSIVGKVIYGKNSFLLMGDSPLAIEKYLVGKYGADLKSDVLKVGHHGSKNSNSEIFVGTVSPTYSVISAGLNNRYGHPSSEAVSILTRLGGQILETLVQGTIQFKSDGESLILEKL